MSYEFVTSLALFAFVSSITPGPNNLMLMASGANYGIQRTIPHLLGVSLGFVFMALLLGTGLINLFEQFPVTYDILKVFAVIYLLYLAWKIANASTGPTLEATGKPFTFLQAALFQWVNPKVWAMALTTISVYTRSVNAVCALCFSYLWRGQSSMRRSLGYTGPTDGSPIKKPSPTSFI